MHCTKCVLHILLTAQAYPGAVHCNVHCAQCVLHNIVKCEHCTVCVEAYPGAIHCNVHFTQCVLHNACSTTKHQTESQFLKWYFSGHVSSLFISEHKFGISNIKLNAQCTMIRSAHSCQWVTQTDSLSQWVSGNPTPKKCVNFNKPDFAVKTVCSWLLMKVIRYRWQMVVCTLGWSAHHGDQCVSLAKTRTILNEYQRLSKIIAP